MAIRKSEVLCLKQLWTKGTLWMKGWKLGLRWNAVINWDTVVLQCKTVKSLNSAADLSLYSTAYIFDFGKIKFEPQKLTQLYVQVYLRER